MLLFAKLFRIDHSLCTHEAPSSVFVLTANTSSHLVFVIDFMANFTLLWHFLVCAMGKNIYHGSFNLDSTANSLYYGIFIPYVSFL